MWELWYTDGSVFTDKDGDWQDAPQYGIQALIRYHDKPKGGISAEMCNGQDLYTVDRKSALTIPVPTSIKVGEEIPREEFDRLMEKIRAHIHTKINNK